MVINIHVVKQYITSNATRQYDFYYFQFKKKKYLGGEIFSNGITWIFLKKDNIMCGLKNFVGINCYCAVNSDV